MEGLAGRCRLCADSILEQVNLLEDMNLATRIFELFNVKICVEDKLPTTACHLCCENIKQTWEFSQQIQRSQEILDEILNSALIASNAAVNSNVVQGGLQEKGPDFDPLDITAVTEAKFDITVDPVIIKLPDAAQGESLPKVVGSLLVNKQISSILLFILIKSCFFK